MRSIASLIVVAALLMPATSYAQPVASHFGNDSHQSGTKAKRRTLYPIEITLKDGEKIKGRSFGQECDENLRNCRMDVVQKGATRSIRFDDIDRIAWQQTFWEKFVYRIQMSIVIVVFGPFLAFACRKDCDL